MFSNLWQRLVALVAMLWREVAKFGAVGAAAAMIVGVGSDERCA